MNTLRYKYKGIPSFLHSGACTSHLTSERAIRSTFGWRKEIGGVLEADMPVAFADKNYISCEYHTSDIPNMTLKHRRRFNRWLMKSAFAPYLQQRGDDVWYLWDFNYIPRSTIIVTIMRYAEEYASLTRKMLTLAKYKRCNTTAILVSIPYLSPNLGISNHHVLRPAHHFKAGFEEGSEGLSLLQKVLADKSRQRPRHTIKGFLDVPMGGADQEFEGVDKSELIKAPWEYFGGTA